MAQETRRRLRLRDELARRTPEAPVPGELEVPDFARGLAGAAPDRGALHVGRFSTGEERLPEDTPGKAELGRFSTGEERLPEGAGGKDRIGRFSTGEYRARSRREPHRDA